MAIPSSQDLRFQILTLLNDQQVHKFAEIKEPIAKKFGVSNDDRKRLSKSKRPIFESRIIHNLSLLRKNGLIVNQKRGNFKITKSGISKLKNP
jgi:restriction endonuclease Mrr